MNIHIETDKHTDTQSDTDIVTDTYNTGRQAGLKVSTQE
jgi:hypothetical protein